MLNVKSYIKNSSSKEPGSCAHKQKHMKSMSAITKIKHICFFSDWKIPNLWLLFKSHGIGKNVRHVSDSCDTLEWKNENARHTAVAYRARTFFSASFETTKNNANASDGPFSPISYLSIATAQTSPRHFIFHIWKGREKIISEWFSEHWYSCMKKKQYDWICCVT